MDIRDAVFADIADKTLTARITAERAGVLSGINEAVQSAVELGLRIKSQSQEGDQITAGTPVLTVEGRPRQLAIAEDTLLGHLLKPSGIATKAAEFRKAADGKFQIICGSWKKVHTSVKSAYRQAISTGGCGIRMLDVPMVYLDKNYIAMLGGMKHTLLHIQELPEVIGRKIVVQVKGRELGIGAECWLAADCGADVIYLDTGRVEDFQELADAMRYMRRVPQIAFGGNVTLDALEKLKACPVDIVGVGKAIIDAPMLDMRFDVLAEVHRCMEEHS